MRRAKNIMVRLSDGNLTTVAQFDERTDDEGKAALDRMFAAMYKALREYEAAP